MEISCIVLAGGKGMRLGYDKVSETIGNTNLLERVLTSVSFLGSRIIVVAAREQSFPQLTVHPEVRIITDIYPGRGALGGLYTGLLAADTLYSLVVAADMPFLNQALLHYMTQLATGYEAVVPRLGNEVEPLHAVYSKSCIAPLEGLLKQGNLKISDVFPLVRVRYVEADEIDRFDPEHLSIFNVNTKADLEKARKLAGGEASRC